MGWRKWNRWLHRELGYLFFGMSIIYGISGIALNHFAARHWDPGLITRSENFILPAPVSKETVDRETIESILEITGERPNFKQYYFPADDLLMIYLKGGHILVEMPTGKITLTSIRNRPFFRELNFLHYNKPRKLWTWFSDLYAAGLILMAVSGLFLVRGRKGAWGRGAILISIGILIPLIFLLLYL
jgi:uncharacterized protein